jgi:hypothetical protein
VPRTQGVRECRAEVAKAIDPETRAYAGRLGNASLRPSCVDSLSGAAFAVEARMNNQRPPLDTDPSDMTDFEKNTTLGELEQIVDRPDERDEVANRERQERGNRGPQEQPGFGQGA